MSVLQNTACTRRASVPLLALAFVQLASSAVSPALANMSQAFPEVSPAYIAMLSTLPSFLGIPCTLLCGKIVGRMVSYRTLAIGGMVISLVCGIAPAFTDSFSLMMLWRALFGMGYGIISPLMMPMVMANFHGEEIYRQTSMNAVSTNVGAVVFQLLGGYACSAFGWRATFLIYILMLPSLLATIFLLPEPPAQVRRPQQKKLSPRAILQAAGVWCVFYLLHMILFYVSVLQTSNVVEESNFGGADTAAIILSVITGGGVLGGYLYKCIKSWGHRALAFAYMSLAAGYLLLAICPNIWVMALGAILIGIGFGINMPALQIFVGLSVPGYACSEAASYLNVFGSVGGFISSIVVTGIVQALGWQPGRPSFVVCMVSYCLMAVALFAGSLVKRADPV